MFDWICVSHAVGNCVVSLCCSLEFSVRRLRFSVCMVVFVLVGVVCF